MALISDPIFYHTIRRNAGGKRKLIHVTNSDPKDLELTIQDVEKPEWVEIEGVYPTATIKLERGKRTPFVVNVNTAHQYFPMEKSMEEKVRIVFDDDKHVLDIAITLPEIIDKILPFRGVFAIDFGTTNSVYSYKGRAMDVKGHGKGSQEAVTSGEIPSVIFFHNVSDPKSPRFSIGREAMFDIKENSGRTSSYLISVKRRLGLARTVMILDRMAGQRKEHRQEFHVEQIASFVVKELIERAEDEIGQKIQAVVATFPPMYSRAQKQACYRAIRMAMESLDIEVNEETLVMDLDEANAGAFNHIYGPLLDEFRNFEVTASKLDLLSMDFGGGTVDISLVSVDVNRNQQGRISIDTELKGLSGVANWAGDNVTLEVLKMVKMAAALAAAEARKAEIESKGSAPKDDDLMGASAGDDDLWGGGGGGGGGGVEDLWGGSAEEKEAEKPVVEEDPDVAEIVNREPVENYEAAVMTVAQEKAVVEAMIQLNKSAFEAVVDVERADGTYAGDEQSAQRASIIESAIETMIPTKFAEYEDVDPFKVELARSLFHGLWHEADLLKVRMASALNGTGKITGVLKKVAKYTGVDPLVFNNIEFSIEMVNSRVRAMVDKVVAMAKQLYEGARGNEDDGGLMLVGQQTEQPPLRVLLLGNCASLPLIQQSVAEAFGAEGQTVVFDKKNLKQAVACGACEEYALRKEFGERGLITYSPKGFLDRLPYSLGIQHRDLALMGYPNGFCPIFERGTEVGAATVLDEDSAFLIHEKMKDLAIFADYKDGAEPVYVGWIDFTEAASPDLIPGKVQTEDSPVNTIMLQAATFSPEGSFGVKFELMGNRELLAVNIRTGTKHLLKVETENWDKTSDPFSGVH
jgi:molecular chaperone DnaK (HSP70)